MQQLGLLEPRVEAVRRGVRALKEPVRPYVRTLVGAASGICGKRARDTAIQALHELLGPNPPNYLNPYRPDLRGRARHYALGQACYSLSKIQQTPRWADSVAIKAMYIEAVTLTSKTGVPHVVDHIVPLSSPFVCGLHCERNLRVVEDRVNQRKSNRWWPGMPNRQLDLFEN